MFLAATNRFCFLQSSPFLYNFGSLCNLHRILYYPPSRFSPSLLIKNFPLQYVPYKLLRHIIWPTNSIFYLFNHCYNNSLFLYFLDCFSLCPTSFSYSSLQLHFHYFTSNSNTIHIQTFNQLLLMFNDLFVSNCIFPKNAR